MVELKILSTKTRVNSLLQFGKEFFNIYRIDLTTGTLRVATVPSNQHLELIEADPPDQYGMTTDGIMCHIEMVISKDKMLKSVLSILKDEPKHYKPGEFLTTDGYYPAVPVGQSGFGVRRDEMNKWAGYDLMPRRDGYKPLITEQCYFSDVWRLLMPCNVLLKHIIEHFGWIADPYDWQAFAMQEQKKWVELPPFPQ